MCRLGPVSKLTLEKSWLHSHSYFSLLHSIHTGSGAPSSETMLTHRYADHSLPSSAEVLANLHFLERPLWVGKNKCKNRHYFRKVNLNLAGARNAELRVHKVVSTYSICWLRKKHLNLTKLTLEEWFISRSLSVLVFS